MGSWLGILDNQDFDGNYARKGKALRVAMLLASTGMVFDHCPCDTGEDRRALATEFMSCTRRQQAATE